MEVVNYILLAFAAVAAIDRIFGSRLGLGRDFERGISMAGPLILAMGGMLVLYPVISELLMGISGGSSKYFDFSIIPAALLANDMGASQIAMSLAASPEAGLLTGMVVSSMMGCTVSFLIPYVLQVTAKERHSDVIFGLLCGIIMIPVGVLVSGIMLRVEFISLLFLLLPLVGFAGLLALGILRFEKATVKLFLGLGWVIKLIITFGLIIGIIDFVTGYKIIPGTDSLESVMKTVATILCVMVGAFPLLSILEKLIKKPLVAMGRRLRINDTAAFGFFVTLGTSLTTFEMESKMDRRGLIFNSAFAVSASFTFMDHLAWTMAVAPETTAAVVVGKIVSGIAAVAFAILMCKIRGIESVKTEDDSVSGAVDILKQEFKK